MGTNAGKTGKNVLQVPPLDELIDVINRQVDRLPHPYATEGFAVSADKKDEAQKKKGRQYLRFNLNETAFALPLQNALEVDYIPEITPLPNLPLWIRGICNLRGTIFSVVELKQMLHMTPVNSEPIRKLILMKGKDIQTAILVDKISGTFNVDFQQHKTEAAMSLHPSCARFVRSATVLGARMIHLLDVDELMAALAI